ncbi:hypothetical protein [Geobacter sp. DSM 9736]|uniref:hypothetical protein n=1 Tax=Geobacter sp. DSM 9736 TaxID=1277350 RepID=UPI000B504F16|nr:hypothetical protein [Geobacter sp. DSM 9736]SNB46695.1 hypothetical protein SAMN06269301_2165 [Geobacter sp. DSM 9736]
MYVNTLRTTVHSQMDTMRRLLLDSIDHPQKYQKKVQDARVVEFMTDGVIREVRKDGSTIREGISVAERKNEFLLTNELLEHPLYSGRILTRIVPTSVQNPMSPISLEVTLELERKDFKVEGMLPGEEAIVKEVEEELEVFRKKAEEMEVHA